MLNSWNYCKGEKWFSFISIVLLFIEWYILTFFLITVLEQSYASVFLNVMGPSKKDPIIGMCAWTPSLAYHYVCGRKMCLREIYFVFPGLSNMLECRRISQPTFYLCLNCAEKVSKEIFYNHLTSEQHQYLSIVSVRMFMFTFGCIQSHWLHLYLWKRKAYSKSSNTDLFIMSLGFCFVKLTKNNAYISVLLFKALFTSVIKIKKKLLWLGCPCKKTFCVLSRDYILLGNLLIKWY